jgi:hypothetical protein
LHKEKEDKENLSSPSVKRSEKCDGQIPTRAVPVTVLATEGFAMATPEAALVTETAGVSMPSAMVNPVVKRHWGAGLFVGHGA